MSLNECRRELNNFMLHFLWRQWAQLGLASADVHKEDDWIIDPEALWLVSSRFARHDARLFDEIIDWLVKNSNFVNISRLKSLQKKYRFAEPGIMRAMSEKVCEIRRSLNWTFPHEPVADTKPQNLFLDLDGKPSGLFGVQDETFRRHGYLRPPVNIRGHSSRFNHTSQSCSLLRLRALFGVNARPDIIIYLLTNKFSHPSKIARDLGYSQKNVQDMLVDMNASLFVHTAKIEGRLKSYFINDQDRAPFIYPSTDHATPRWVNWPPIFRAIEIIAAELQRVLDAGLKEPLLSSELRKCTVQARSLIDSSKFGGVLFDDTPAAEGRFQERFISNVDALIASLNK